MAAWKLAPALLGGNAVVVKPSPSTPLATLRFGELLDGVLPPGVVQVLVGDVELGRMLPGHPDIDLISFTGSPGVGWDIASRSSPRQRPVLELGGNDPAILLPGVDVASMADDLFAMGFLNNGQACIAIKRIYAPAGLAAEVVDALASLAEAVEVGDGADPATKLGPLTSRAGRDRVEGLVDDARSRGARVAAGGMVLDRPGHFYAPTVVADLDDDAPLVAEEQFGPALPVVAYDDIDRVVDVVNSGPYGLGASVWAGEPDEAAAIASRIDSGVRWVNCHGRQSPDQPFGGRRDSGFGVENGSWGLESYCNIAVDHVAT